MSKIVLNYSGVRELLQSDEMQAICDEHAKAIAKRAGDGYESDTYKGKTRVNSAVYADTYEAKLDNMKNDTLLKALK